MADRLSDLIVGLQRMAEGARFRTDDLEYTQREERYELVRYIDQLLETVDKLRASLLEDRKRLMPVRELPTGQEKSPQEMSAAKMPQGEMPMPKFLQQGPRKDEQDQTGDKRNVR